MLKQLCVVVATSSLMILFELPCVASPPADKNYPNIFGSNFTLRVETDLEVFHDAVERAKTNPSFNKKIERGAVVDGMAEFNLKDKICTIYWPYQTFENPEQMDINSEENRRKLILLGHELLHCLTGNFHD